MALKTRHGPAPVRRPIHVRTGDTVVVISGKDRGKRGKILRVVPKANRVVVEGVNVAKKHVKPNQKVLQGGIIDQENPVAASNVMLVCRSCHEPARTGVTILEDGRHVRRCKRCGEIIDR
ncbi:MAG TPA: 50S ribosomal protein L24 [Bacillota bacterium]|nr:50S ribosomal protein L24 [Bacillota bacterium]